MDNENLKNRCKELEAEVRRQRNYIQSLEKTMKLYEQRAKAEEVHHPAAITSNSEMERILANLVKRVAQFVQAEKCLITMYQPETDELLPMSPAYGLNENQVKKIRVKVSEGLAGRIFRTGIPAIANDALHDPVTIKENVALIGIRNIAAVPLIIITRDEEGRVIERQTIGVLQVFDKWNGGEFTEIDLHLLSVMAKNAAAVIANARMYMKVIEEKAQIEATIESITNGLVMVDATGRIQQLNSCAKAILNIPDVELPNCSYRDIITNETVNNLLQSALDDGEDISDEMPVKIGDSERTYQIHVTPVRSEQDEIIGAVATFNDITEIRKIEKAKTAFVSMVSHELRTPLTSIKGFINTLIDDRSGFYDEAKKREFYLIIDSECERLTRMISDLLDISRIEAGKAIELNIRKFELEPLAKKVINIQKSYAGEHIFEVKIPPDFPEIYADEDKIDQILTNLINNAIKYSPNGGIITIASKTEGDWVAITVKDQGIGIPKEHLGSIFDRFHRVETNVTRDIIGTGIGLYLVKRLVDAHHGEIWVESNPGKGSAFTFTIPNAQLKSEFRDRNQIG